jgi:Mlc titration factor MtfA (ptsG expression regulator)
MFALAVAALGLAVVTGLLIAPRLRRARRARRFALPLAADMRVLLEHHVPLYRRLPLALRAQLHGHLQVFLSEKRFVGCNGLAIDLRMQIVIAAQACLLILNRATDYFPGFTSILVYPESFVVPLVEHDGTLETRRAEIRSGEAWERGPVILSWDDIVHGTSVVGDGYNVVLHEFAHKLDEENGAVDGMPALASAALRERWADVMEREYELLRLRARNVEDVVLDDYGATAPAEFFAVSTEAFFENSRALAARHPRLYEVLRDYYQIDPANWGATHEHAC